MKKLFIFAVIILSTAFFSNCGDDGGTGPSATNTIKLVVTGDTSFTFEATKGQLVNSSSDMQFTKFQSYITSGDEVTAFLLQFKDYMSSSKEFDLSRDGNYAQISFKNGAISYQSYIGTLTILERGDKRIKANINFKAKKVGDTSKEIEINSGTFDFAF